jgi:hypothetical protein
VISFGQKNLKGERENEKNVKGKGGQMKDKGEVEVKWVNKCRKGQASRQKGSLLIKFWRIG